jgi:hypothetical protein
MNFNKHSNLDGQHAYLSASKFHWLNYDDDKLRESYRSFLAAQRGTELHAFAAQCIRLGQKLPKSGKTLNQYVNDAIGYGMTPELPLYYSDNCFGTTDAICLRHGLLRIHDLKTGVTPAHIEQLRVYAGLFCLEYRTKPESLQMELRLYQNDAVLVDEPSPGDIQAIMDKIVHFDKVINELKQEA